MQKKQPRVILAERYYLQHFLEFLQVIETGYGHVLEDDHLGFVAQFNALDEDAQCLYVRMLNRKGKVFNWGKFNYPEIKNIPRRIEDLIEKQFIRRPLTEDFDVWLKALNKQQLIKAINDQCPLLSLRPSWSKSKLLTMAQELLDFDHPLLQKVRREFVIRGYVEQMEYLLFLYFGKYEETLSRFTLRDIGVMKTSKLTKGQPIKPRFENKQEAKNIWFYCQKQTLLKDVLSDEFHHWIHDIDNWPDPINEQARLMYEQVLYELGDKVEKNGDDHLAESVYRRASTWPATERLVRIVYRKGDREQAEVLLQNMIDDPDSEEALLFAQDFYQRKFQRKRTSRVTDILRNSVVIAVDESHRDYPEEGVAAFYRSKGAMVFHCENRLWKKLFGLLFWHLLFKTRNASIYNDFDRRPQDLETTAFYRKFSVEIEKQLALVDHREKLRNVLTATVARDYGVSNGILRWSTDMMDEVFAFLSVAPAAATKTILRRMAKDYAGNHAGYPDLMIVNDGHVKFVEVKAEGDQLRRNQLKQILALQQSGFDVSVNRIEWIVDPNQLYVVVDIETTGGRATSHRITEIAAIKMRNGEVLDQWQSLINPRRPIPAQITALTSITNSMVADAPVFAEIADEFDEFCENAVFVAHNVRFDYGFICEEYRRLGCHFHRPTLCSCVQMRKWYPGLPSYSLGNLSQYFDIDLDQHHRALCDAEAAAELLMLVNAKRMEAKVES